MRGTKHVKGFFDDSKIKGWSKYWKGMPEFIQHNEMPQSSIIMHFRNVDDRRHFLELIGESPDIRPRGLWYPRMVRTKLSKHPTSKITVKSNKYPIYIVSKGRWESRVTSRELEALGIPYRIVVEPLEYDKYASVIAPEKIIVLPFSNLGQGSIPARNWIWEHALSEGAARHWILDDNIQGFYKFGNNKKVKIIDENPFILIEKFVDRYTNIALAGMQYEFFIPRRDARPPYLLNTRIYSCTLIKNDIPYRWRGKYNEDTDLSIRVLKDKWVTVLFNVVLAKKITTMTMKGGNTDELYKEDGRLLMAKSLRDQHPDVVRVSRKWGRWQHHVDYRRFKHNKPILKEE